MALDQQSGRLDARLLAVMDFEHLDLETAAFGPARVHAQQHRRPVLALGAAGAGVDFEIGVVGVGLAREHRLDLARLDLARQRADRSLGFGDDAGVALFLAELDQADIVVERLRQALDRRGCRHRGSGARASASALPGGSFQRRGILRAHVQVFEPFYGLIPVKDASSAGLSPA